ncbi:hypothetical protein GCM10025864_07700 [Luteimicrobium album]|uniref:Uncharacterized protein n=1 Tax=Luteimicrobium album TaxID=1054550 RepID=A0ABQ6HYB2_9MICO|nr:hypothetical protein GCM10025864_07700 [Luteimicrobium album]
MRRGRVHLDQRVLERGHVAVGGVEEHAGALVDQPSQLVLPPRHGASTTVRTGGRRAASPWSDDADRPAVHRAVRLAPSLLSACVLGSAAGRRVAAQRSVAAPSASTVTPIAALSVSHGCPPSAVVSRT